MSAAVLAQVLAGQEADAARIGDRDQIEAWRAVIDAQRHTNP